MHATGSSRARFPSGASRSGTRRARSCSPRPRAEHGFPGARGTPPTSPRRGAAPDRRAAPFRSRGARRAAAPTSAASARAPRACLSTRRSFAWTCPTLSSRTLTTSSFAASSAALSSARFFERTSGCAPLPTPRRPRSPRRAEKEVAERPLAERRAEARARRHRGPGSRSEAAPRTVFRGSRRSSAERAPRSACASRFASTRSTSTCRRDRERSRNAPRSSPEPSDSPSSSASLALQPEVKWGAC